MYKSKENMIVCCRKSAFLKDNLAKKGANIPKISAFVYWKEICYASKI